MQMTHFFVLYACLQGKKGDLACGRMNQYPTVFVAFKGIGELTFEEDPGKIRSRTGRHISRILYMQLHSAAFCPASWRERP